MKRYPLGKTAKSKATDMASPKNTDLNKVAHSLFSTYKQAINRLLLVLLLSPLTSCDRYLEVGMPSTQLAGEEVFKSDATATAALSTIYARAAEFTGGGSGSITVMGAYLADETDSYSTIPALQQMANNQLIPSSTYSTNLWVNCYAVIYQCNVLIEAVTGNPALSKGVADRLKGEALFLRAYAHLSLASFYGAVPLAIQSDYRVNNLLARDATSAVYDQVIADLKEAKALLPTTYSAYANERIGANRWTASALLSRAYLYSGDNASAKAEASTLIGNSLFALLPLSEVFIRNSAETILSYKPISGALSTPEGNLFILTGKPLQLALSASFLAGFEAADQRKVSWTGKITVSGTDYHFPFKYKVKNTATGNEYSVLLRLAEQYLIRAEAQARLGELPAAIADLDVLRSRAGLSKFSLTNPTISQSALLDAVLQERRSELFTEWNHRWVDLQRFGKAAIALPLVKPDWKGFSILLPIPDTDMRSNLNLVQNPGYQ